MTTILSIACFAVGVITGWMLCSYAVRRRTMVDSTARRLGTPRMIELLLAALVFATALFAIVDTRSTNQELSRVADCQAVGFEALSRDLAVRSTATGRQNQAQIELLTTPPGDQARGRAAVEKYLAALIEQERVRAATPLVIPRCE